MEYQYELDLDIFMFNLKPLYDLYLAMPVMLKLLLRYYLMSILYHVYHHVLSSWCWDPISYACNVIIIMLNLWTPLPSYDYPFCVISLFWHVVLMRIHVRWGYVLGRLGKLENWLWNWHDMTWKYDMKTWHENKLENMNLGHDN